MKTPLHLALCAAALFLTPAFAQEGDPVRGKIKELEERARTAKEQGRPEESNELMEQAKRLRTETGEREGQRGGGDKFEMVKRKIGELRKEGKDDEAGQLERHLRETMEKQEKQGDRKGGGDGERRQHVKEAVRHLHAAGLHEPAQRIEQMLREQEEKSRQAEREHREHAERSGGPGDGPEPMQRAMREMQEQTQRAMRTMQEQTQRALRETHEQMAKMARTIDELREQLGRRGEGERRKD